MAFRLMDFGIPNFDTNVDFLYKTAIEHGTSYLYDQEEYVVYRLNDTPALVVLHFTFEADGETPKECVAHTFLDNDICWQDSVETTADGKNILTHAGWQVPVEIINESIPGATYIPMLFADDVCFGGNRFEVRAKLSVQEGVLMPMDDGRVQLMARIESVKPIIMSKLWMFSVLRLKLEDGTDHGVVEVVIGRDMMEKEIQACEVGGYCFLHGPMALMKAWEK